MSLLLLFRPRHRGGAQEVIIGRPGAEEKRKLVKKIIRKFRRKFVDVEKEKQELAVVEAQTRISQELDRNPLIDLDGWLNAYLAEVKEQWLEEEDLVFLLSMIDRELGR